MSDLSVVVISVSVIVLCWAVVRINQRLDRVLRNRNIMNDLEDTGASATPPPVRSRADV